MKFTALTKQVRLWSPVGESPVVGSVNGGAKQTRCSPGIRRWDCLGIAADPEGSGSEAVSDASGVAPLRVENVNYLDATPKTELPNGCIRL